MTLMLVGLNHRTTPIYVREQFALTGDELHRTLQQLRQPELVILSTCNRLEFYAVTDDTRIIETFLDSKIPAVQPYLYIFKEEAVVAHLMKVSAGLDSMILGEPQILGQVNQAYQAALLAEATGPVLSRLFLQAVHCGKRVRTETDISRYTTSASHTAVLLAKEQLGDLSQQHILILGAGEMADQVARAAHAHGAIQLTFINRTYLHAAKLAKRYSAKARDWPELVSAIDTADLIFVATGAPTAVIDRTTIDQRCNDHPLFIVDLAVPRNVEPSLRILPNITLYDLDQLQATLDGNLAQRQATIPQALAIVKAETQAYLKWLYSRQVVSVIVDLRRKAEEIAQHEVEQALRRLGDNHSQEVLKRTAHRIVNKLLYEPTARLKSHAATGNGDHYADAMRELFNLDRGSND